MISGDTAPTDDIVKACDGCDELLHEDYNPRGEEMKEQHWADYFHTFHTSPDELADIARRAHPKLLVVYHQVLEKRPEPDLAAGSAPARRRGSSLVHHCLMAPTQS